MLNRPFLIVLGSTQTTFPVVGRVVGEPAEGVEATVDGEAVELAALRLQPPRIQPAVMVKMSMSLRRYIGLAHTDERAVYFPVPNVFRNIAVVFSQKNGRPLIDASSGAYRMIQLGNSHVPLKLVRS